MIPTLVLMCGALAVCWHVFCRPGLHDAPLAEILASTDLQILAGGVVLLTALMPAVRFCSFPAHAQPPFLASLFGFEAALCIAMLSFRASRRRRIVQDWEISSLSIALRRGLI